MKQIRIQFPLLDTEDLIVDSGLTVADACLLAGRPMNLVCGGKGTCGKCDVNIEEKGQQKKVRGCMYKLYYDVSICIGDEKGKTQILEASEDENLPFSPQIQVRTVESAMLAPELCSFDLAAIRNALDMPSAVIDKLSVLRSYAPAIGQAKKYMSFVVHGDEIIDVIPSEAPAHAYGFACDIGTTTVVGYLYDLVTGRLIGTSSRINKQIAHGGDVISRLDFANQSQKNLDTLQTAILDTINIILNRLTADAGIPVKAVYQAVFCGNSTMCHLFWGIPANRLAQLPFTNIKSEMIRCRGDELPICMNPSGFIVFLPLLGGFVGADTTSAILSLPPDGHLRLMIDLGTNGEIAVGNRNHYLVTSTACGPALEGAGITMGMRGTTGAVEKITFENGKIHCTIIGNGTAKGLCGSGIIDAVAFLLKTGIITPRGNFIPRDEAPAHPLSKRLLEDDQLGRYFVFMTVDENAGGKAVILTQKDIREVQLAKAAIFTGCISLMQEAGISEKDLKEITIAGAFGNYIDVRNAQAIGLIPAFSDVAVRSIGNAAGTGVKRCLLSGDEMLRCTQIPGYTKHVELATNPDFVNAYIRNTSLGTSTDLSSEDI